MKHFIGLSFVFFYIIGFLVKLQLQCYKPFISSLIICMLNYYDVYML